MYKEQRLESDGPYHSCECIPNSRTRIDVNIRYTIWINIVLLVLVGHHQILQVSGYVISATIPQEYIRLSRCRKCLQRFISNAFITYDYGIDHKSGSQQSSLRMYAEIANDIPYDNISKSCNSFSRSCLKFTLHDEAVAHEK